MTLTLTSFMMMAIAVRELADHIAVFEILVFRSLGGLILLLPFIIYFGISQISTSRLKLHCVRHSVHFAAQYFWFLALTLLPLAEVFALEFTAPIWVILIAAIFLKEPLNYARVIAVAGGFAGVLVILRPGIEIIDPVAIIVLASAFGFACSLVLTKVLTRTDTPMAIIFYMSVFQAPLSMTLAYHDWYWPGWNDLLWVIIIGVAGNTAHYSMARALKIADASVIFPMDFLRVPLIAVVGYLIYSESLDLWVVAGGSYNISRQLFPDSKGKCRS